MMSTESSGSAPADVIGTTGRDVRRGPVNHPFFFSEAWAATTLGEIADIRNGATPSTHVSANWDGSIPWCTPTDITNTSGKYLTKTARRITEKGLADCGASLLPTGALLLCSRATIGEIKIASFPVCTNQGFKSLICTEQAHNEFLYYLVLTLKPRLIQQAIGSTFLEIGKQALVSIEIRLPPLKEQRAIAGALSDVDRLIGSLESLIAKKQAIKQATMQQLLSGKTRLPGFRGSWTEKSLVNLAIIVMGQSPSSMFYNLHGEGLPLIQGNADIENRRTIERMWTTQASKYCDSGDLLLTVRAPVGYVAIASTKACLGRGVCSVKPFGDSAFLFHTLRHAESRWQTLEQGSTFTAANSVQVKQFRLRVPEDTSEQRAIAAVLSDMDTEIAALEWRHDKTRALKQGMMQQLLTGKIRLVDSVQTTTRQASSASTGKGHNWQINEAVVISILAGRFGNEEYPLGRMRYTKLSYLLHRHVEGRAEDYLKKAAGPYNPRTRYGGPEKIALEKGYVRKCTSGKYHGFIAGDNAEESKRYFDRWYGREALQWLEQFRYRKNNDLELLTTVDMAIEELRAEGEAVSIESVREVIHRDPEWTKKLARPTFSSANLERAIGDCEQLFGR